MENQIIDDVRNAFVRVLVHDRQSLVNILNKNGFVASSDMSDSELTILSLHAIQLSNNYRNDLAYILAKNYTPTVSRTVGFAAQPMDTIEITTDDMCFNPTNPIENGKTFVRSNIWAD